jgi:hypothetical protein
MSAFKQFLSTDVTVVPFVVNKSFTFKGTASLATAGIKKYIGKNTPYSSSLDRYYFLNQTQSAALLYNSIKQLYYTNYIPTPSQSQAPPPVYDYNGNLLENYTTTATNTRFYNYEQTSLFQTGSGGYSSQYGYSRYFPTSSNSNISVLSIPKNLFGDYINPNTFYLRYWSDDEGDYITVTDNGEGILQFENTSTEQYGVITYQHGLISSDQSWASDIIEWVRGIGLNPTCSFQSTRTIFETQYKCTIRPDEFNFSLNPSLISGSTDGTPYNFVTGSYFAPYITTIGLYNENQELLAVAKLAQPLPTSRTTDTTVIINLDM